MPGNEKTKTNRQAEVERDTERQIEKNRADKRKRDITVLGNFVF